MCVVLDDLHWADAQSLALLKHLLRSSEQSSLQMIVTYRDSDLGKDHPLTAVLADLRSLPGVQRIALHGLGADEVAEIMSAVAGHELEAGRGRACRRGSRPRPMVTRSSWGRSSGVCRSPAALVFDEDARALEHRQLGRDRAARERARGDRAPRGAPRRGVARGRCAWQR